MEITKQLDDTTCTVSVAGRLNTGTAPELEAQLRALDGVELLILDLSDLDYISSAGLRVILSTQKVMNRQGKMLVRNVKPEIYEVFEMTGFSDFLNIEQGASS